MNELLLKAKEFLDDFVLDFGVLREKLTEIGKLYLKLNNCDLQLEVSFDKSMLFGKSGSVFENYISFNKTRIETLFEMKIDCNDDCHLHNIYEFYNMYNKKEEHSICEQCLYEFMQKYISLGCERYFDKMGSYKMIKYELLDTILHENQHIVQRRHKEYLASVDECPLDDKNLLLFFTMLFNEVYSTLKKAKVDFDYVRENYIFPIGFDARYEAMIILDKLREKYFKLDNDFETYLCESNIIPKDFDIEKTANQLFDDYLRIYEIYRCKIESGFEDANKYVLQNKNSIVAEIMKRYKKMVSIGNKKE